MSKAMQNLDLELDETLVADYLAAHPEFFAHHEALLESLVIPHPLRGEAVSLLERKVELLREENNRLHSQVRQMTRNARSNEELLERVQGLMLNFLACDGVEAALESLRDWLREDFRADLVAVRLMAAGGPEHPDLIAPEHPGWGHLRSLLDGQQPMCGRFSLEQLEFLFGEQARRVGSAALIPLCAPGAASDECAGVIAIASADPSRFHAEMGTLFLAHMGAIIGDELARRLARLA